MVGERISMDMAVIIAAVITAIASVLVALIEIRFS